MTVCCNMTVMSEMYNCIFFRMEMIRMTSCKRTISDILHHLQVNIVGLGPHCYNGQCFDIVYRSINLLLYFWNSTCANFAKISGLSEQPGFPTLLEFQRITFQQHWSLAVNILCLTDKRVTTTPDSSENCCQRFSLGTVQYCCMLT